MLRFSKGSAQKSPVRTPDTLITVDTVELLLGLCEGPIKGLVNGPKTFYVANTALVNEDGKPNFSNFALQFYPGSELGDTVTLDLGGFSNPINIGTTLAEGTPVTRTGITTNIDAIDFRVLIQTLVKNNDKGTFTAPLSLKFEIKKQSETTWRPAWTADVAPPIPANDPGDGDSRLYQVYGDGSDYHVSTFTGDVPLYTSEDPPVDPPQNTDPGAITYVEGDSTLWSWGGTDWVQQPLSPGGSNYKIMGDDNHTRLYSGDKTPTDARQGDLWYTPSFFKVFNGTSWVDSSYTGSSSVGTIPADGIWTIDEKVTSPTAKDLRVYVSRDPDAVWEFRVTKLSQDSDTEITSVVSWESVQEIKRTPWQFTALAMARVVGQSSDQFTSLPQFTGDYDLRIVKVPSNYDPEARTYTGVWDGTYKMACTSNAAYCFQDFVENERYGLSSLFPHTCNKWSIYAWGQYNDQMVSRPDGTHRPRWTFNDIFLDPRDAKELAQYIAGSAGARMVDDGNGNVDVIVDMDADPVMIFTPENVGEDGFVYSYTDRLTRSNEIIVEFINPKLEWQSDKRIVRDEDDIAKFGRISENFVAVGCTDEDEAIARARRRLIGGLTEKEIVTFTTNRKGTYLSDWDLILVADPEMGRGITGRIRQQLGANGFTLRDPVTLDPGIAYKVVFEIRNPAYPATSTAPYVTVSFPVNSAAGTWTTLVVGGSLPTLPPNAVFVLEAEGFAGMPKPYRVTGIENVDGEEEVISVTAVELNRNKYSFIDTGVDQGEIDYGGGLTVVEPPSNLQLKVTERQKGLQSLRVGTLTWAKSPTKFVRQYKITHQVDGVPSAAPAPTSDTSCEFEGLADAQHVFTVTAVDLFGRESKPAVLRFNSNGITPVTGQFNFRLKGGGASFQTLDPVFEWDNTQTVPNLSHWEILILEDESSTTPIRIENVGSSLTWQYDYAKNTDDHGGVAPRTVVIGLRAVDSAGNSSEPDVLSVTNPAPAAPRNLEVQFDADAILVKWDPPLIIAPDFGGTIVLCDTHSLPTTEVFHGTGNQIRIPINSVADYHVKVGHYDLYDPTDVVYSLEMVQGVSSLFKDQLAAIDDIAAQAQQIIDETETNALALIQDRLAAVAEIRSRETQSAEITRTQETLQSDLEATATDVLTLTTDVNDNFAVINDTLTTHSDQISATATSLSTFGALNSSGDAFIIDTNKAFIDGTTSLSDRLTLIENRFGGTASSSLLTQVTSAASDASSAISSVSLMGAKNSGNTGFVLNTSKVFVGSDGTTLAQYIQSLSVSSTTASAIADSRISVQLGLGGSIASAIQSVKSTADGASATASIALDTANGNSASVAALTQVGGKITGFKLNGSNSSFVIQADKFVLISPDGSTTAIPFSVVGGFANFANPVTVTAGSMKLIIGPSFGQFSDLLLWYGPVSSPINVCSRANATFALCSDGTIIVPGAGVSALAKAISQNGGFSVPTGGSFVDMVHLDFSGIPAGGGFWKVAADVFDGPGQAGKPFNGTIRVVERVGGVDRTIAGPAAIGLTFNNVDNIWEETGGQINADFIATSASPSASIYLQIQNIGSVNASGFAASLSAQWIKAG